MNEEQDELDAKGPVDPVDEVLDEELGDLEEEGRRDVEFLSDEDAAADDTVDNEEGEDEPASEEVRREARGDD